MKPLFLKCCLASLLCLGLSANLMGVVIPISPAITSGDVDQLYVVNIDGTGLTNLTPEILGDADVANGYGDINWSPDGTTLYYIADTETNGVFVLHSVVVPEPGTLALLAIGALGLAACARRGRHGR